MCVCVVVVGVRLVVLCVCVVVVGVRLVVLCVVGVTDAAGEFQ